MMTTSKDTNSSMIFDLMRSRRIQRLETDEADILLDTNAEYFSLETTKLISRSRPMKLPSQPGTIDQRSNPTGKDLIHDDGTMPSYSLDA
ncbi:hypothetical protein DY000_02046160 [Brassica cretica]|uniref:Uncharacterized protein n=1 Tax=Brassica cretica TaxID=69181 RepID=A0ABQ7F3N1_BRACR|nr:hypothetical protein DY000_02046160 [Brassica cretica]